AVLEDLEASVAAEAADARGITADALRAFIRERGWCGAEEAVERGLLDRVLHFGDLLEELETAAGVDDDTGSFRQVGFVDWVARQRAPRGGSRTIAVLYAEGEILDGEGAGAIGGNSFSRKLRALRDDDEVDAVVLRVDSPGGSAAASELILQEVQRLKQRKPVVISMGGVAASGGYWISCQASRIVADPATVTGSIGVLGLMPNAAPALARLGIHVSTVRTSPYADALSLFRARDEAEMGRVQEFVDAIYETFLDRVAEGRGLPRERVHELAQGRVWSGTDAAEFGLVDALGGLGDAVRIAAQLAGAGADGYRVQWHDRAPGLLDRAMQDFFQGAPQPIAALPASLEAAAREAWSLIRGGGARPAVLARLPFSLRVQ
ncbi:MAG: signal peptide peptidase SppA, partial [Planctomycetota bacterium]|nr:signal peptide peptidase SppA [Planctomycetota bacterium]